MIALKFVTKWFLMGAGAMALASSCGKAQAQRTEFAPKCFVAVLTTAEEQAYYCTDGVLGGHLIWEEIP
jgi:hypothetical protein